MKRHIFISAACIMAFNIFVNAETSRRDTSSVPLDSIKVSNMQPAGEGSNNVNVTWYQMITQIPADEYLFFQNSLRVSEIPTYIGLTALTGTLMKVDQSGWKANQKLYNKSYIFRTTSDLSVYSGDGRFHFMLSGAFAAYGLLCNNPAAIKTSSNIAESVLATGLLVQVLKRVTGRQSPAYALNARWKWQFFPNLKEYQKNQPKYYSFPSGHLAAATATLTVIANNYPEITWLKPVGYPVLGLLGIGLVSKGMHWYSDLPLGFFIGYTMGNVVSPALKLKNESSPGVGSAQLSVIPGFYNKKVGLHIACAF